jgi:hypothetical protein
MIVPTMMKRPDRNLYELCQEGYLFVAHGGQRRCCDKAVLPGKNFEHAEGDLFTG